VSGVLTIAAYALRESTRRRVFLVVLVLTVAFLALYAVGTEAAFDSIEGAGQGVPVDEEVLTGPRSSACPCSRPCSSAACWRCS
jgi:hypothetical protein